MSAATASERGIMAITPTAMAAATLDLRARVLRALIILIVSGEVDECEQWGSECGEWLLVVMGMKQ